MNVTLLNPVIKRSVLTIAPSPGEASSSQHKLTADVSDAVHYANEAFKASRHELMQVLLKIPGAGFLLDAIFKPFEIGSENDIVENLIQHPEMPRLRILCNMGGKDIGLDFLGTIDGATHACYVVAEQSTSLRDAPFGVDSVRIAISSQEWKTVLSMVLHDVLVDISIFNSWPGLRVVSNDSELKSSFNVKKWEFAKQKGLQFPPFGKAPPKAAYLPLSTAARAIVPRYPTSISFTKANAENCVDLWVELAKKVLPQGRIVLGENPIDQIRRFKRIFGQISLRKLQKKLEPMPPGEYYFVRCSKRPKVDKIRVGVAKAIGLEEWSRRQGVIIAPRDFGKILRLSEWYSIFHLVKPDDQETINT